MRRTSIYSGSVSLAELRPRPLGQPKAVATALLVAFAVLASSEARGQIVFRETFGTVNAQLPTATSTADGNWVSAACLNGQIIAGGSPSDTTGSTRRLFHNTASCSYTSGQAVWRTVSAIPVQPNRSYAFSYWTARANTSGDAVLTQAVAPNVGGSVMITHTSNPSFAAAGTWVHRFVRFTTDATTTSVDLRINNANTAPTGNDFWLDDIVLEDVSPPTLTCTTTPAVFNTAYDGGPGTSTRLIGLADRNWEGGLGTSGGGTASVASWVPATIIGRVSGNWTTSPFANAEWISYNTNGGHAGNIDVYYRYRFTLDAAVNLATFGVSMTFFSDNSVQQIYINNVPQSANFPGVIPQPSPYAYAGFDAANGARVVLRSNWQIGANELIIHTASGSPWTGFLAQMTAGGLCQSRDWGDAPMSYATTPATNGPSHTVAGPYLGASPADEDFGGVPSAAADGDDTAGDDEDGVAGLNLPVGTTAQIQVTVGGASAATRLQAWVDWGRDGSFSQPGDRILTDEAVVNGVNTFNVPVPLGTVGSTSFARFRIADASGLSFDGPAASGEVEDHRVLLVTVSDWGDAPASYATSAANNGPSHVVAGPYLGAAAPDQDVDGVASALADADDSSGDDEDGVVFPILSPGATASIQVTVGNATAATRLQAWIDWNRDGTFAQAGEQVLVDAPVVNGANTFNVAVPPSGTTGTSYARVRIADGSGLSFNGPAASGEVEDHQVTFQLLSDISITKTDGRATYSPGTDVTYTIVVTNAGPSSIIGSSGNGRITDTRPAGITTASWTCTGTNGAFCNTSSGPIASGTGNIGVFPNATVFVNMPASSTLTLSYTMTVPPTFTGDLVNTARVVVSSQVDVNQADNAATDTDTVAPADLTITKVSAPNPYDANAPFSYTIVASNLGPGNAPGATISDTLPPELAGFGWTCSGSGGATCGTASGSAPAISTTANLPVGGSVTILVTGNLPANTIGTLTNTATIAPPSNVPDPVMANNTATDVNPRALRADLRISKASTPNPYVPGEALTYTIVVSNDGPDDAPGARVQDPLPAAFAAFTWTCVAGSGAACQTASGVGGIDALVDLPVGTTATFTATGTVPSDYADLATNTATISPPPTVNDPVPGNNTATSQNPPGPLADLRITKAQTPDPYVPGQPLTYTLLVENLGPSNTANARVQDVLPGGLTNVTWTCAASGAGASCGADNGVNIVDAFVTLPVGTTATFTISATVDASATGVLINTATVTAPVNVTDPVPGNNTSMVTSGGAPLADLSIVKTASANPYLPGGPLSFTMLVSNNGPSDAPNSRVQDLFPASLSGFTWTCAASSGAAACDVASGISLIDTLVDLPAGAAVTFTVSGTVPPDTSGSLTNTATVAPPLGIRDPDLANNLSAVTIGPGPQADLRITKTSTPNPYVPGTPITYTIVATNDGPSDLFDGRVQDVVPPVLQNVTWTCSATDATCPVASGTGSIDALVDIAVGGTVTFTLTGDVPSSTRGALINTATILPPSGTIDATPNNNSGVDTNPAVVIGGPVDLQITQEFPGVAPPNGLLTFRLRTRNLGPNTALNPYVTGMIPPGTTFVSVTPSVGGTCNIPGNPPAPDPVTGYPVPGAATEPLRCTWPGLMKPGESHFMEFTVRVAPGTPTGQILWSCWWTWPENEDVHHANNVVDAYLFVDDGTTPVGDLQIQAAAAVVRAAGPDGSPVSYETIGTELAVRAGTEVPMRFWVTNHGPAATRGQYALILDTPNTIQIVDIKLPQGWVSPSGPSSGVWDTGVVQPGQTVALDMTVRLMTPSAVELFAQRITGSPGDPNATNERATIVLDGYAPGFAGRWVAVGNVDGAGAGEIVTGAGQGETPQVRVFTGTGADTGLRFFAYERPFAGGVQIASCDVNGDGVAELITAPGPGRAPTIRVLSLVGGVVTELVAFDAFEPAFTGGASVACADLDADGSAEVVIGAGPGRAPEVQVYNVGLSSVTPRATFLAYEAGFLGGVRVAAGVYPGRPGWLDAFAIATTPGAGRAAELRLFTPTGAPVAQVVVSTATKGVLPTLGDVNGDSQLDLIVAPDDGRPELVRIFEIDSGQLLGAVPGGSPAFPVGIRTAVGLLDGGPGQPEIVIGNGPGGHPRVRVIYWPASGPTQRLEILPLEIP